MSGETEICGVCGKNMRINVGLFCKLCKVYKHRKCEKVDSGVLDDEYVCRKCRKQPQGNNSVQDCGIEEDIEAQSTNDRRNETKQCEFCLELVEQNEKLIEERDSLKAIVEALQKDLEQMRDESRKRSEDMNSAEWIQVCKEGRKKSAGRRSIVMELKNRFEGLGEDTDSGVNSAGPEVTTNRMKASSKRKKRKVLLLSSSQGRNCSKILGEKLGDCYEVCGVVKPNAKFSEVAQSVDRLAKDFGKDDCVIVMAGGNDEEDDDFRSGISRGIEQIMKVKDKTKIIVNVLPPRYDKVDLTSKVRLMNRFIHNEVNIKGNWNNRNLQVNFAMERMDRNCFTSHGLHLNHRGKITFCERMVKLMRDFDKRDTERQVAFLG